MALAARAGGLFWVICCVRVDPFQNQVSFREVGISSAVLSHSEQDDLAVGEIVGSTSPP